MPDEPPQQKTLIALKLTVLQDTTRYIVDVYHDFQAPTKKHFGEDGYYVRHGNETDDEQTAVFLRRSCQLVGLPEEIKQLNVSQPLAELRGIENLSNLHPKGRVTARNLSF
jgi:hypothetical protein